MKMRENRGLRRWAAACAAGAMLLASAGCGINGEDKNLLPGRKESEQVVNMFSPMEKTDPNAENVARTASDLTIAMAEERLGVTVTVRGVSQEEYDALVLLQPLPEDVQAEGSAPQQVGALGAATGDFTLAGQTFSAPYSDAGALLERFCSASGDNVTGYASDAFDILLSSARAAVDS